MVLVWWSKLVNNTRRHCASGSTVHVGPTEAFIQQNITHLPAAYATSELPCSECMQIIRSASAIRKVSISCQHRHFSGDRLPAVKLEISKLIGLPSWIETALPNPLRWASGTVCAKDLELGLCAYVIVRTILPPGPAILWIALCGTPKMLPMKFGYNDVIHTALSLLLSSWSTSSKRHRMSAALSFFSGFTQPLCLARAKTDWKKNQEEQSLSGKFYLPLETMFHGFSSTKIAPYHACDLKVKFGAQMKEKQAETKSPQNLFYLTGMNINTKFIRKASEHLKWISQI